MASSPRSARRRASRRAAAAGVAGLTGIAALVATAPMAFAGTSTDHAGATPAPSEPPSAAQPRATDSSSTEAPADVTSTDATDPADDPSADYGTQKIRVGVQSQNGPADASTLGSTIQIVETGPNAPDPATTTCTTTDPDTDPTSTATYCVNEAGTELDPPPTDFYEIAAGDTATVTQLSPAEAGLVVDTSPQTVGPCDEIESDVPICVGDDGPLETDVIFTDTGLPPTTQDDSATTLAGDPVDIDVLANDDTQGQDGSISAVTQPAHGTAAIVTPDTTNARATSSQVVRYTPDAGFVGNDAFTYTLHTVNGDAVGHVTVTVNAPPPVAHDDSATIPAATTAAIAVLANDDAEGGGPLSVTAVGTPSHGTATIHGSDVDYTPAAGFVGSDSFTYTAHTAYGDDTATVTVTVTAAPTPSPSSPSVAPLAANSGLPYTGAPTEQFVELAGGLLLGGGLVRVLARRRRRRGTHA